MGSPEFGTAMALPWGVRCKFLAGRPIALLPFKGAFSFNPVGSASAAGATCDSISNESSVHLSQYLLVASLWD